MPIKSLTGLLQRLRISDPFNYKIPLLMAVPYLYIAILHIDFVRVMLLITASIITCLGFAGFGYATNDWSDIDKDQLANKSNAFAGLTTAERFGVTALFLALAIAPWFYLPFDGLSLILLILELLLFSAYAFPPLRLKERGFLGVIADSLYAHALPAFFAAYTFSSHELMVVTGLGYTSDTVIFITRFLEISNLALFAIILFVWQFVAGLRNIINHQIEDFENDKAGASSTFVMRIGIDKADTLRKFLIPLEVLLLLLFLLLGGLLTSVWLWVLCGITAAVMLYLNRQQLKDLNWKKFSIFVLEDFYLECIPIAAILVIVVNDYKLVAVLLLHMLVFRKNIIGRFIRHTFA